MKSREEIITILEPGFNRGLIKQKMREMKISFPELSKKTGIGEGTIKSIIQKLDSNPTWSRVAAICHVLGINDMEAMSEDNLMRLRYDPAKPMRN